MQHQLEGLLRYIDIDNIYVVVGYKKEMIMEAFPELFYIYNNTFETTNTSKSLLKALKKLKGNDVIWINGDVVFEYQVIERVVSFPHSCVAVNTLPVGEEEVKYRVGENGLISQISKEVANALGEAVGINKVLSRDLPMLVEKLKQCNDMDYFEKALEMAVEEGIEFYPLEVTDLICKEVDFEEDLKSVNEMLL